MHEGLTTTVYSSWGGLNLGTESIYPWLEPFWDIPSLTDWSDNQRLVLVYTETKSIVLLYLLTRGF